MKKSHNNLSDFLKRKRYDLVGIAVGFIVSLFLSINLSQGPVVTILTSIIGGFAGWLVQKNIEHLWYYKKCKFLTAKDKEIIDKVVTKGRSLSVLERKIFKHYHGKYETIIENLFGQGVSMPLSDYEEILSFIIDAIANLETHRAFVRGTCLILPTMFDPYSKYANIWRSVSEKFKDKGIETIFIRLLCDHKRENLLNSIKECPDKFKTFCEWNKETNFDLFVYRGDDFEQTRIEKELINDFMIFDNTATVGGIIAEEQKRNADKKQPLVSNTIIKRGLTNYSQFFDSLIKDCNNNSMKIPLDENLDLVYEKCVNFLQP